ncbi:hypothetical protein JVU11DRAFT_10009 [Chiua virens]|nr:hypothetical protein JVU11DRAFT_10009 [Chiua virens]
MHRCLTIVEVQHAIFREVQGEYRGKAILARLARTCRTFNNAALDILWETLPSIRYLIRCLPTDLWKIPRHTRKIIFQRAMSSSDWEIFFRCSSRIRSLSSALEHNYYVVCDLDPLSLDIDIITALSRPPGNGPLVPKLKTLVWTESDDTYTPLLQSLLPCSLVDLSLPSFALRSPETIDLITRCPLLKSFCIQDDEFPIFSEPNGISSGTLTRLRSLKSLECHTLNEAAIVTLSNFPSLVELSGKLKDNLQLEKVRPYLAPPTFPSLESLTLDLGGEELSTLTSILEVMRFSPREVSFILDMPPTPDMLDLFFLTLVNACGSERLSHISLTMLDEGGNRPEISLITFRPLLALPNVTSFILDVTCDIDLNDDAIDALTKHWPKLTKLSLNALLGWGIESGVTHRGLITLLTRCVSLTDFALAVDFSEVDTPPSFIPRSRPAHEVTSYCRNANFVSSTIEYPASIAAFLSEICTKSCSITSFWDAENEQATRLDINDPEDCYQRRWERVDEFLPGFLAVRAQERGVVYRANRDIVV